MTWSNHHTRMLQAAKHETETDQQQTVESVQVSQVAVHNNGALPLFDLQASCGKVLATASLTWLDTVCLGHIVPWHGLDLVIVFLFVHVGTPPGSRWPLPPASVHVFPHPQPPHHPRTNGG